MSRPLFLPNVSVSVCSLIYFPFLPYREDIVKGQARRQDLVDTIRAKVEQVEQALLEQEGQVKDCKEKVASALKGARRAQFCALRDAKMFQLKKNNSGEIPPGEEVQLEPTEEDLEEIEIVQPSRDSNTFKTKLKNKEKKIEQEKVRRNMSESDPAVAREKYFRAKEKLDSEMKQIETIERNCNSLKSDLKERKKRWRQFRSHIAEMTNLGFDEFLNKKGSAGIVEFNHEEQKLDLIVQKVSVVDNGFVFDMFACGLSLCLTLQHLTTG